MCFTLSTGWTNPPNHMQHWVHTHKLGPIFSYAYLNCLGTLHGNSFITLARSLTMWQSAGRPVCLPSLWPQDLHKSADFFKFELFLLNPEIPPTDDTVFVALNFTASPPPPNPSVSSQVCGSECDAAAEAGGDAHPQHGGGQLLHACEYQCRVLCRDWHHLPWHQGQRHRAIWPQCLLRGGGRVYRQSPVW